MATLHPTALVHEAYFRLGGESQWNHRGHFFAAAAQAMRRILIERAASRTGEAWRAVAAGGRAAGGPGLGNGTRRPLGGR